MGGEQFDLYTETVTMPSGERLVVEARRPKLGNGESIIVIRTLGGVPRWKEVLDHDSDLDARVATLSAGLTEGRFPA